VAILRAAVDKAHSTPGRYRFYIVGYRTYVKGGKLHFADKNGLCYRDLLLALKQKNDFAVELFADLLCLIFDDVIGGPDAIACVPPSSKSSDRRDDALAVVVQKAVSKNLGVIDGSSWLRRTQTVPKAHQDPSMRSFEKQYATIDCSAGLTSREPRRIVVIDDICTSAATMTACVSRLKELFPKAGVTGFAFGFTGYVGKSPPVPDFTKLQTNQPVQAVAKLIDEWRNEAWPRVGGTSPFFTQQGEVHQVGNGCQRNGPGCETIWSEAEAIGRSLVLCRECKPFERKPRFELNQNTMTIHHVDCHTEPFGAGLMQLWSLQHGIRLGGEPCKICMPRWIPTQSQQQVNQPKSTDELELEAIGNTLKQFITKLQLQPQTRP